MYCIFTNDMKLTRQNMKYCVHIVCNEIQVKVNLEITTFFFICVFHTVLTFSDLGLYIFVPFKKGLPHPAKNKTIEAQ